MFFNEYPLLLSTNKMIANVDSGFTVYVIL